MQIYEKSDEFSGKRRYFFRIEVQIFSLFRIIQSFRCDPRAAAANAIMQSLYICVFLFQKKKFQANF